MSRAHGALVPLLEQGGAGSIQASIKAAGALVDDRIFILDFPIFVSIPMAVYRNFIGFTILGIDTPGMYVRRVKAVHPPPQLC